MNTAKRRTEYGDFQTPRELAVSVAQLLKSDGVSPAVVVEPTCGLGAFIHAAQDAFLDATDIFAFDVNPGYVEEIRRMFPQKKGPRVHAAALDFFDTDWERFFQQAAEEILVIGNPPWATNSTLGSLHSTNLPEKSNFLNHGGFAAKTGKANFDISEWMLIRLLDSLTHRRACLAMLCKTTVARKVLKYAWLNRLPIGRASIHRVDADAHFGVSVDACLLIVHTGVCEAPPAASVYPDLSFRNRATTIGLCGRELVANVDEYMHLRDLDGFSDYRWRSGVKHDASRIMELTRESGRYRNGFGEEVAIEETCLFPLFKSSDLANGDSVPSRVVLLTQRRPSDDTSTIKSRAPDTWQYLVAHAEALDARRSIIYRKRHRFSVFGIGNYTFAPWKVAVSGLYKTLRFRVVGSFHGKPCVVDDTCYCIPCQSETEATFLAELLNSDLCLRFLHSIVFLDAKRPITVDILNRIDLRRLADHLGVGHRARAVLVGPKKSEERQLSLAFERESEPPVEHSSTHPADKHG